jgi:O-antigen/teichoic acid export membrane protein
MLWRVLSGSLVLGTSTALCALLEYLYIIDAAHNLSAADFGILNTVLAILTIVLAVVTSGVGTSLARFVAERRATGATTEIVANSLVVQLALAAFTALILAALAWLLLPRTRTADLVPFLLLLAAMLPALTTATVLPLTFQGLERMPELGTASVLNGLFRVLAAALFIRIGLGVFGALISYLVGAVVAGAFAAVRLGRLIGFRRPDLPLCRQLLWFSLPVSLITVLLTCFTRLDVVLMKGLLADRVNEQIGAYAGPAAFSRLLFHFATGICMALLPALAAQGRTTRRELGKLLTVVAALFGVANIVTYFIGADVMALFFEGSKDFFHQLLTRLVLGMSLLGLAYLLATVFIAIGHPQVGLRALLWGCLTFVALSCLLLTDLGWTDTVAGRLGVGNVLGVTHALIVGGGMSNALLVWAILRSDRLR